MKNYPIIKPTETFRGGVIQKQLDLRDVGEFLGEDLHQVIIGSVAATQQWMITELPSFLLLTHRQFVSIMPYTAEMMYTEDRFYKTALNVMEIVVNIEDDTVHEGEVLETFDPMVLAAGNEPGLIEGGDVKPNSRWAR
jgi:hypothetical protein